MTLTDYAAADAADIHALYAEAMLRGHSNEFAALSWLVYDWRQHPSARDLYLLEHASAKIRAQMEPVMREAFDAGITLEELQRFTRTMRAKHAQRNTELGVAA